MNFYSNLKSLCDFKGVSVSSVLTRCGLSKSYGTNWKRGSVPSLKYISKLFFNPEREYSLLIYFNIDNPRCFPSVQRYCLSCFVKRKVSVFSSIPQKILWINKLALLLFHTYPLCFPQSNCS